MVQIVSISSCKPDQYVDETCLLQVGDHSFVTTQSFVSYFHTKVIPAQAIQLGLDNKLFVPKEPLQEEVFARVHAGVDVSDDTPIKMARFWRNYC